MRLRIVGKTNHDQPCVNTITVRTKDGREIVLDRETTFYHCDKEGFMEMDWDGVYDWTSGTEKDVNEEDLKGATVTDIGIEDDLSTPSNYYFIVVRCVVISDSMKTSDNFSLEVKVSKEQVLYQINGLYNDIYRSFSGQYMTFRKSLEEILKDLEGIKANISKLDEKPGAISFLRHLREMCNSVNHSCYDCPIHDYYKDDTDTFNECCPLWSVGELSDERTTEIVKAVENWYKEELHLQEFCDKNRISYSSSTVSYYFEINNKKYCVSNNIAKVKMRDKRHDSSKDNIVYIHAGKTRIIDIYNDLTNGYELDGRGYRR